MGNGKKMTRDKGSAPQQPPNFVWEAFDSQPQHPAAVSARNDGLLTAAGEEAERDGRRAPGSRRGTGRALIAATVLVPLAGGTYALIAYSARHDDTAVVTAHDSQAAEVVVSGSAGPAAASSAAAAPGARPSLSPAPSSKTVVSSSPGKNGIPAAGPTQGPSLLITTVAGGPVRTVTVSAAAPTASASQSATTASGPATGPIVGYQGLCLDDRGASVANYNPVQVYTCNDTDAQQWTLESNDTIEVFGMCLDVYAAGTAGGTRVDLYQCNGTNAQTWVPQSDGALVNPESGQCLDDTEFGGAGTQVEIWTCNGGSDQVWKLP